MFAKKKTLPTRRAHVPQSTVRSNNVFSYHANRSVREGSQLRDADREAQQQAATRSVMRIWRKRLPNLTVLLAVGMLLLFSLQLGANVKVVPLGSKGGQLFLRSQDVYTQAAREGFEPLLNKNKLTVNTDKIAADLRRQFPELKVVSVALPVIGAQPVVYIQPATPKLILVAKNGMYVLDDEGRALIPANQVAKLQELGVPAVTDESDVSVKVGSVAVPRSTVTFITEIVGQLKAKHIKVNSLTLTAGSTELQVRLEGLKYFIKCNLHGDARAEVGTFLAVKEYLEAVHRTPSDYVDVRVENKAYYK